MTFPTTSIPSKFLTSPHDLGLIAVGFSGGQCKPGTEAAPSALLNAGLGDQITHDLNYTLHHDDLVHTYSSILPSPSPSPSQQPTSDATDDPNDPDPDHRGMKNPLAVSRVCQRLSEQVYTHAREGRMVLTLGGDHSIAIGTVSGIARAVKERFAGRRELAVLWVDAHADINTPETSDSGNVHGMPLAWLTGLARADKGEGGRREIFGWLNEGGDDGAAASSATADNSINGSSGGAANGVAGEKGAGGIEGAALSLRKLVYIGLRDVDPGEKAILREHGIRAFSMNDIDRHGIGRVMDMALAHIGQDTPIHLSFDVDALDPQWAPSTGTPVRGGLTLREGDFICECVHETGSLVAMDLVEVNPLLVDDGREETVRAGVSLVRCALGDTLL